MVQCKKIDGEPCSCDMEEPCTKYLVQSITCNLIKHVLQSINADDIDELQQFVRMPDAAAYVRLYIDVLVKRRGEMVDQSISYMTETIVIYILRFVLRTITVAERDELDRLVQMPDAAGYLRLYAEELDNERAAVGDIVLSII